jgi:uncharacterized protein
MNDAPTGSLNLSAPNWAVEWRPQIEHFVQANFEFADRAHDLAHLQRVVVNVQRLLEAETANPMIVFPAAWLHDCVAVPKDSDIRMQASRLAAAKAAEFLSSILYPTELIPAISHAIEAHSFSAGIAPQTIEAKIVQDADRLDALGAIGLARCLLTAGAMGAELYHLQEPIARTRPLDDRQFAIDHFFKKLLLLPSQMQTPTGRLLAQQRAEYLIDFLNQLASESDWPDKSFSELQIG